MVKLNNYQLLDLLGLLVDLGYDNEISLPSNVVVLKDNIPIKGIPKSKIFTLNRLFTIDDEGFIIDKGLLENKLEGFPFLKHLRVFFAKFTPDEEGIVTQKSDMWEEIKAWRYDIDVLKDEDLVKDKEGAIKRLEDKWNDILEMISTLPLKPNIIKRSNKGWHLIYVFDEFITRDAYDTYLERYNKPGGYNIKDDIADQFMVFELLTKYIPKYLAELEPLIDIQASNKISSIATRFITEELPAYLIHEPYSLKEFYNAFAFLLDRDKEEDIEVLYKQGTIPYTPNDISKETFLSLMDRCGVLKALDENWENHTEPEWFVMTNYYAIRILYAETPEEAQELRKEFHEKSSRWYGNGNKQYTYNEAERQLEYYIEKQQESIKPPACKYLYNNLNNKYNTICHSCPYRRFDTKGNIISNFIFDGLKSDSLEDITIPGWKLKDHGWYIIEREKDGTSREIRALSYLKIRSYYFLDGDNVEMVEIIDNKGISTIQRIERRKDTLQVYPDVLINSISSCYINHDRIAAIRKFLVAYIDKIRESRGVRIKFLGYRYINGGWDIAVGGDGNYRRKDLEYIFYGGEDEQDEPEWFIPSVQGNLEAFKNIYRKAFSLDDPPLHLAIAHFLSWIGMQFVKDKLLRGKLNPVLIFMGDNSTGKTVRANIAAGLYGNPVAISFSNTTLANFNNHLPLTKAPVAVDEVIVKSDKDEEKLGTLLYNIGNKHGKRTAYKVYKAIRVPVLLIGETENLIVDQLFSKYRGLSRRSIVVRMTTEWEHNGRILDTLSAELEDNHGHILSYVRLLGNKDREEIEGTARELFNKIKLSGSGFIEIRNRLGLSLSMFKHFFKHFIGYSDDVINKKIDKVIEFVIKEIGENQSHRIGDNMDYVEEVIEFISSVLKAEKREGISLKGMNYKGVKARIDYKPSDKISKLLKKFFWKRHKSGKSTNLTFSTSVLITNPISCVNDDDKYDIIGIERERLSELTDEELKIWVSVLQARYDSNMVIKILDVLRCEKLNYIISFEEPEPKTEEVQI